MASGTIQPALELVAILGKCRAHGALGGFAIGPGGSGGNVAFVTQAHPKLLIGSTNVLAQGMSSGGLVSGEIARCSVFWRSDSGSSGRALDVGWLASAGTLACQACHHNQQACRKHVPDRDRSLLSH